MPTITAVDDPTPEGPDDDNVTERALWCMRCMLPSAVRIKIRRPFQGNIGSMVVCVDCHGVLDDAGNVTGEVE